MFPPQSSEDAQVVLGSLLQVPPPEEEEPQSPSVQLPLQQSPLPVQLSMPSVPQYVEQSPSTHIRPVAPEQSLVAAQVQLP